MRTYLDCLPCIFRQCLDSARFVSADESLHERVMREALKTASEMDLSEPPPLMARRIHRRIRELSGIDDPYRDAKDRQNRLALELYEQLHGQLQQCTDLLEAAVRLAMAGNLIDLGVKSRVDDHEVRAEVQSCLTAPVHGDIAEFKRAIAGAERILYLTDNAGEIVFDRFLIEQLPRGRTTVAVRGRPVINDATLEDAHTAGITALADVIDNGSDVPGTVLSDCSEDFRRRFAEADLIISKGQGNYETLCDCHRPIYFLLRVKCPVVARDLGCPVGNMVLWPAQALPTGP